MVPSIVCCRKLGVTVTVSNKSEKGSRCLRRIFATLHFTMTILYALVAALLNGAMLNAVGTGGM